MNSAWGRRRPRVISGPSAACERAIKRGTVDEWVRPTLLGVAFDLGDPDKAEELAGLIEQEGADAWKLETTLASLQDGVAHSQDATVRARLQDVLTRLARVLSRG
jgi:hypothetical protein